MKVNLILTCLTLLLLPAYVVRFQVGPVPSTLLEGLILLTLLSWIIENRSVSWRELRERVMSPVFWLGLALVLVALIEVWFSADQRSGLGEWRAYFLEPFLLSLVALDLARRGMGKWLLLSLIGSGAWVALIAIGQFSFHLWSDITPSSTLELSYDRAISIFNSGNSLALYLGALLPVVIVLTLLTEPYLIAATLIFILALWGSKSHGGWLASAGSLGAMTIGAALTKFSERLVKLFWRVLPALPILSAVAFLVFMSQISSFAPIGKPTDVRIYQDTRILRLCLWQGTENILRQNPITGSGLAGFSDAYAKNHTCDPEVLRYPHNIFLNFWVETGLVGLLLFLALLWQILKSLGQSKDKLLALGLAGAFTYLLFHGLVDVPYFKNDLAAQFWVLAALAIATAEDKFSLKS